MNEENSNQNNQGTQQQNQNVVQTPPVQQAPTAVGQSPQATNGANQTQQVTSPVQMPQKVPVKGLKTNLMEKFKSAPKNVKLLVVVVTVFVFLILILLIAAVLTGSMNQTGTVAPTATPAPVSSSPLPQVEITNPSKYATDSGVLKIEADVDSLSKEMDSVDLRQSTLRVPALDFDIKF